MRKPKQPSSLRCLRIFWLISCTLLLACMGCNSISRYGMDAPSQPGAKTNSTGARGDCGNTPLHEAAAAGNLALAEKLIQEGAEVGGTSKDGATPLHWAAWYGHVAMANLLLKHGAAVDDARTQAGFSALDLACIRNHLTVVKMLLNQIQPKDQLLSYALCCAYSYGNTEIENLLREHGADVNARDTVRGRTALHEAAAKGYRTLVRLLLQMPGIRVEKDFGGYIPPHEAARHGHGEILRMLLKAGGSDVNAKSSIGSFTPIHEATLGGHPEIVKMLIEAGADVNAATWNSTTPIHIAAQKGYPEIVRMLIEAGADVNTRQYPSSTTPLEEAAQNGHSEAANELMRAPKIKIGSKEIRKLWMYKIKIEPETRQALWRNKTEIEFE